MSGCKHHYIYAYESTVGTVDVKYVSVGYMETTLPKLVVGVKAAFYQCSKCGDMLIMKKVGG